MPANAVRVAIGFALGVALATAGTPSPTTGSTAAAIVLPRLVVAGRPATLAVLDEAGALLPGAEVEFRGGAKMTTDATGRATFTAPTQVGVLIAQAVGTAAKASAAVIVPPENPPDGIQVTEVPQLVSLHEPFSIAGAGFRGEAEGTHAWLGGQPALVLAASPVALVVLAGPRTPPGAAQLVIEADGRRPGPVQVTLVALEISSEKQQLAPKEKGKLTVLARGSEQRLEVEVRNLTPDVVKMPEGADVLRATTRGGAENTAEVELEGRRAGDFSVSVRLIPPVAGLPDVETARQKLIAARRIAPPHWSGRLDGLIERIEKNPQDVLRVRRELEKMLAENPAGEFGRLLEAAWLILLKR
ncbi:MAG: hypothetical protein HY234_04530 [Acidobacteria bacterium]|nr:hypothetical protein [Acidobacteriota bacterium]MBI3662301.1 hypothetical protein [Acidobacteriota bacterium]